MIESVTYKECTCDFCGKKKQIAKNYDMPGGWSYLRYILPKNKSIVHLDMCEHCAENMVVMIEGMVGGAKDGK